MFDWSAIDANISAATGRHFDSFRQSAVGGGCINSAYVVQGRKERYFVKLSRAQSLQMFDAEAKGLHELAQASAIRVPQPVCSGKEEDTAFLVMEHLVLKEGGRKGAAKFGAQLAQLHRVTSNQFGWCYHNTIGATPQINSPNDDWVQFFGQHRLGYQLELAARNGFTGNFARVGERLIANLAFFFDSYNPRPSLLHGDLWAGNHAVDGQGNPVIFDPAVYYGDRETDVAMTELFGRCPSEFYSAYQESWPLDVGYAVRKKLYNLYHILNHLNLFGTTYLAQAQHTLDSLISEL